MSHFCIWKGDRDPCELAVWIMCFQLRWCNRDRITGFICTLIIVVATLWFGYGYLKSFKEAVRQEARVNVSEAMRGAYDAGRTSAEVGITLRQIPDYQYAGAGDEGMRGEGE